MRELCLLLHVCVVVALPSLIPTATLRAENTVVESKPTPKPEWRPELVKRERIGSNTCGWMTGNSAKAFTCDTDVVDATCLWNNDNKFVACGNATKVDFVTSCIEYNSASANNCDAACQSLQLANPSVSYCPSWAPYCSTVLFPNSFSMIPCGTAPGGTSAELTTTGQTSTLDLPRFVINGAIVTALPVSQTSTTSSASPSSTYVDPDGGRVNTGSIVAASIGGGVLLLGLPFGIKMFLRKRKWKKAQRPRRLQEREMRRQWEETGNPYASGEEVVPIPPEGEGGGGNFLFSQDWPGGKAGAGQDGGGSGNGNGNGGGGSGHEIPIQSHR